MMKDALWNQSAMARADSVREILRMVTYAVAEVKAAEMPQVTPGSISQGERCVCVVQCVLSRSMPA